METLDSNEKYRFKKFDTVYIRLCLKETNEYMECLDQIHYNDCQELKKIYLNCINYNTDKINKNNFK